MRVALLHPTASEALLDSLGPPLNNGTTTGVLLPSLQDPKLRARISPALFLKWNSDLRAATPKDLEAINLYATERRGDFDEAQRIQLDGLLQRLRDRAKLMTPGPRNEMHRPQREQQMRENMEEMRRLMRDQTPGGPDEKRRRMEELMRDRQNR